MLARSIELTSKLGEKPPNLINMHFSIVWLGDVTDDLIAVEIKDNRGELGWLYSDQSLVVFLPKDRSVMVAFVLSEFKEYVEEKLRSKQFSAEPEAYKLTRSEKSIVGWIPYSEIPTTLIHIL